MATIFLTPDQDAVVSEIEIAAPPQRVFAALTDPEQNKQWGRSAAFEITLWEMDPRVGGAWRFVSRESGQNREYLHHGEVLEFDPPRVLAYTWFANWHEQPSRRTVVRWELTASRDGTKVKVTHSGLAAEAKSRQDYYQGWPGLLALLKKFLENQLENPMATITVTSAQDAILAELFIDAPPARVFQAITDPAQLLQWWGQEGMYRTTGWQGDLRVVAAGAARASGPMAARSR